MLCVFALQFFDVFRGRVRLFWGSSFLVSRQLFDNTMSWAFSAIFVVCPSSGLLVGRSLLRVGRHVILLLPGLLLGAGLLATSLPPSPSFPPLPAPLLALLPLSCSRFVFFGKGEMLSVFSSQVLAEIVTHFLQSSPSRYFSGTFLANILVCELLLWIL